MKSFLLTTTAVLSLFFLVTSCQSGQEKAANDNPNSIEIVAKEVIQATNYTYVLAEKGSETYWLAIPTDAIEVGKTYYHGPGMVMQNFESKDLERVFEEVLFLESISSTPIPTEGEQEMSMENPHADQPKSTGAHIKTDAAPVSVKPAEGGITLAELFENKSKYAGQKVILRGQIIKVNNEIMDRNWIHIQDGTSFGEEYDLVVTTDEYHEPGAIVTFEGIVAVDKDFGAGYFYKVIVEEGKAKLGQQKI